jgi:hypothetical protein
MKTQTRKASSVSLSVIMSAWHDPVAWMLIVDLLTVLLALLLPWSTTGVAIAAILFTIAVIPTLEPRVFLQSLRRPACLLPVSLLVLALVDPGQQVLLGSLNSWDRRVDGRNRKSLRFARATR